LLFALSTTVRSPLFGGDEVPVEPARSPAVPDASRYPVAHSPNISRGDDGIAVPYAASSTLEGIGNSLAMPGDEAPAGYLEGLAGRL
jgi:hypothetical protein